MMSLCTRTKNYCIVFSAAFSFLIIATTHHKMQGAENSHDDFVELTPEVEFERTIEKEHQLTSHNIEKNNLTTQQTASPAIEDDIIDDTEEEFDEDYDDLEEYNSLSQSNNNKRINAIIITRHNPNPFLPDEAIRNTLLYHEGEVFKKAKTNATLHKLYHLSAPFSYFETIDIMGEDNDDGTMNLHVITVEKPHVSEIIIEGNTKIKPKEIEEKLPLDRVHALNENDLAKIADALRIIYREKDFHHVDITTDLQLIDNRYKAYVTIKEHKKTQVKRIFFTGNEAVESKRLRRIILTHEDWLLNFINKAGTYDPERIEIDRQIIASYYKTLGYFKAKITGVDIEFKEPENYFIITYNIFEGPQYTVGDVHASGNDLLSEEDILARLPIRSGAIYSSKMIQESLEYLRTLWGDCGYAYADIDPVLIPNDNDRTIDISFNTELGERVTARRISIFGNNKTREKVIRRRLLVQEGELITHSGMEGSKARVELLGYFDKQNGSQWRINRIDDHTADLDFMVNEVKTGRFGTNIGYGGDPSSISSVSSGVKIGASLSDSNFLGAGMMFDLGADWSPQEWSTRFSIANPWFMDKPIFTEYNLHVIKSDYSDELRGLKSFSERTAGSYFGIGYTTASRFFMRETTLMNQFGFDNISYSCRPAILDVSEAEATIHQAIIDLRFQEGTYLFWRNSVRQDQRNHPMHPTRGYQWSVSSQLGFGVGLTENSSKHGFYKIACEGSWYTPLIGEQRLIFGLRGFLGLIKIFKNRMVPYKELFHIGGPASVRGFRYGQIGPIFKGDSIGATKAFFWNAELIFPIVEDFSIKGRIFWDGGAGWDTPPIHFVKTDHQQLFEKNLRNNSFDVRHAIGFGISLLKPQPFSLDWGFKLDRRRGEKHKEVHFSAYREF